MSAWLRRSWRGSLVRIMAVLALAGAVGLASGQLAWVLVVGLAGLLGFHLWQLYALQRALLGRRRTLPDFGPWRIVAELIRRRQARDRTVRRRLLDALQAFRNAAAALPDGTIVLDAQGHIQWFNAAASRLLGLRTRTDLGTPIGHLVRHPRVTQWLADEPQRQALLDVPAPADDHLRLSFRMIAYGTGLRLLVVRDISQLLHLEQVRRDFVANVSHELRTPLTVLAGYLDAVDEDELPEWAPILQDMQGQCLRMRHIVEDLLTLSRLDAQGAPAEELLPMPQILDALKRDARALSQGRHQIELGDVAALDLVGSGKDLRSAFSNLVVNAVRYTPAHGQIRLNWVSHPDGAAFEVVDTGPGIPEQHLPRLTERFYRVSTSRSRESGGTGLGLAIVKHVLMIHQGRLEIESEVGRGSTFRCVLPAERLRLPEAA
ncbi:MAG: phosphate regulon sensor histidine kinase PhoR [Xanthomonadales bacterium]|nr:phosphate regulon sensor histidine kinase PhoR [Xanthomonadales bacterium]MCB1627352.1 phosphate regulon sensor histidine kinase PhoR [Xanthomonadales bacterium]